MANFFTRKATAVILQEIAYPFIRRASGYLAVSLGSYGVATSEIEVIVAGVVAAGGVAVDLILSAVNRR